MTPEERLTRVEEQIEKQNEGIRGLIVVGRTCVESIQGMGESVKGLRESVTELRESVTELRESIKELRDAQAATDEKLNILISTVDRITRQRNGKQ